MLWGKHENAFAISTHRLLFDRIAHVYTCTHTAFYIDMYMYITMPHWSIISIVFTDNVVSMQWHGLQYSLCLT